uniref:Zinc finger protein Noc n=1 Tax=Megaselia scalaris TaxID=36166 RepID=T1GC85_MEGSC
MDSKKSPLALLAQTCSKVGADTSPVPLSLDKKKVENPSKSPVSSSKTPKSTTPTSEIKLAFKPYENNVLSRSEERPSSKSSIAESTDLNKSSGSNRTPSRNTPENNGDLNISGKATPNEINRKTTSPGSSQRGASPIIRSGMEVLSGGAYKPGAGPYGLNPLSALCCPPGMEQHAANPAFRPPFAAGLSHHAAMLAAAASGYPGASTNPYISYQRIKTATGEAVVPVCKDPYCPGCPYSAHTQQMMMGAPCPAGCTQSAAAALAHSQAQSLLGSLYPPRGFPAAPLSPMSAARYHPYSKPGLPPPSPFGPGGINPAAVALAPFYTSYAMYGQRLGSAAVHQ